MRMTVGRKLAGVVGILALVGLGISVFAIQQAGEAQRRSDQMDVIWNTGLQAHALAQAIEHAVVQATALYTADDTSEAKGRLGALQTALTDVEHAKTSFFAALEAQLTPEQKRKLDLGITEFLAYQRDTAEMGLTISPKAALIQASDEATVKNRERMVVQINALGHDVLARLDAQRAAAAEAQRRATITLIAVPAAALGIALLLAFWIVRTQIQGPLLRLRGAMRGLAGDQLSSAVPFTTRRDEVGEMARAIEGFRTSLIEKQTLGAQARDRATRDIARAQELAEATRAFKVETASAMSALAASAEQMEGAADLLSGVASDTTARTEVVARASEQSADVVNGIASAAEELSSSAFEIEQRVQHTSTIAAVALRDTHGLEATVAELSRAAAEIGAVVTVIRTVASQTNLLALNATIEAARAGEAGRGFVVVAAEVKALAGQTALATDRIVGQVEAIQAAAQDTTAAIGAIAATIAQMSATATAVAASADDQGKASQEIARAIASAAAGAQTVAESIGTVQVAAASGAAQAGAVRVNAMQVSQGSHALQSAIATFLDRVRAA
ncbi:methyl-accepting chemotaxis protein [Methylobacterium sp.]|jgi:methyl-accepting chemotaxis protein|uniref:methyl-accepting chemotaxis protein n=1 Tax=Methylobacterium sp. TaxID=409 RepID=UPI0004649E47|nr:methyl-accepting chemotaxis protein [Methylobacterium sp.]RUP17415.1 MAG: HAMP domain-containing protein [Methylobacterium sp.]